MTILHRLASRFADLVGLPMTVQARIALDQEPINQSATATASSIQTALRNAEAGNTRELFALYRDLVMADSHVTCELGKRKLAVLAQPPSVQPADKNNAEDQRAANACRTMIARCENWSSGLNFLLDSTLWPVSVVEKLFAPSEEPGLRYILRRLEPVNYTLLCFRQPAAALNAQTLAPSNPGAFPWEPDLRFYTTDGRGVINWSVDASYTPEPARHLVHRGHLFTGTRDNFGGPMRALLWWCFLTPLLRDWWARASERYGAPFPVGHTDITSEPAVELLKNAFAQSAKIGGLVVDHETQVELIEAAVSGMADNFERFGEVCNREKSKVILGQELSATSAPTGLGSGVARLQGEVREDYRMYDQLVLGETLRSQLFTQFLRINGLSGNAPRIVWGGLSDEDAKDFAELLDVLSRAGLEPTDEALPTLSERLGIEVQRKAAAPSPIPDGPLPMFSAPRIPQLGHPTDRIAAARAKALGDVYRGAMAPFREIVLRSSSPEEAMRHLSAAYRDWKPARLTAELEVALQICAAAGAAAAKPD